MRSLTLVVLLALPLWSAIEKGKNTQALKPQKLEVWVLPQEGDSMTFSESKGSVWMEKKHDHFELLKVYMEDRVKSLPEYLIWKALLQEELMVGRHGLPIFSSRTTVGRREEPNASDTFLSRNRELDYWQKYFLYELNLEGRGPMGSQWLLSSGGSAQKNSIIEGLFGDRQQAIQLWAMTYRQPILANEDFKKKSFRERHVKLRSKVAWENLRMVIEEQCHELLGLYRQMMLAEKMMAVEGIFKERVLSWKMDMEKALAQGSVTRDQLLNVQFSLLEQRKREHKFMSVKKMAILEIENFLSEPLRLLEGEVVFSFSNGVTLKDSVIYRKGYHEKELAQLEVDRARSYKVPNLDMIGQYEQIALRDDLGSSITESFKPEYPTWSIGFELEISLGKNNSDHQRWKVAKKRLEASNAQLIEVKRQLKSDEKLWRYRLKELKAIIQLEKDSSLLQEEILRLEKLKKGANKSNRKWMVKERETLLSIKKNMLQWQSERESLRVQLWLLDGGLWRDVHSLLNTVDGGR